MAGRCLIVANQTLGGVALEEAVQRCIDRGVTRFHVVVPMTRIDLEAISWTGGFALGEGVSPEMVRQAVEEKARLREAELEDARVRAEHRLALMVERIDALGGDATGEIGGDDPFAAAKEALEAGTEFDEIIVSTLPAFLSRWLKMDLPNRIGRLTDVPVTTIEAKE
ncbi:hypothetical protein [Nitriliruptor alkaliphilus]|uniref:hypothetical protein n=1 Tax=Nitriliruptor alkaliphilus TaxID=427918 RepID=UPI0006968CB2|nr:hypothetical protein [Nitriliruptor alkaliphilus]